MFPPTQLNNLQQSFPLTKSAQKIPSHAPTYLSTLQRCKGWHQTNWSPVPLFKLPHELPEGAASPQGYALGQQLECVSKRHPGPYTIKISCVAAT
jgi:hypothetical protein